MEAAGLFVKTKRLVKALEDQADDLKKHAKVLSDGLLIQVDDEQWPESSRVDGATVFRTSQLWAGPAKGPDNKPDHARLAGVLDALGLEHLLPKTVNAQALSGYVRELMADAPLIDTDGNVLTLDQRARLVMEESLCNVLALSEPAQMKVNGAGSL